ncbi:hypothetical protein B7463_g3192, partial [Scytalidium lignicola]
MSKPQSVKIAAVQSAPVAFNLEESLKKVESFTAQAATEGAQLVVFPEAFLSAYPWRYAFDATIGTREPRGRTWYAKYYDSAVAIPSPEFNFLLEIAEKNKVFLTIGIIEKDGGTLYCTNLIISKEGTLLNRHRKLVPTAVERLVWGRGSGDSLKVVDTGFGKLGGLICWENYMPAARLALYQLGIDIYVAPNADDLPAWVASMQHIAKEGRCFVISVSDFPADYPPFTPGHHDRNPEGLPWSSEDIVNHGGSCIVGPLGTFIADPVWDKEEIIYATLNLSDLVEARMDFDPVGSYSRPDVFSLRVNTDPAKNVTFSKSSNE